MFYLSNTFDKSVFATKGFQCFNRPQTLRLRVNLSVKEHLARDRQRKMKLLWMLILGLVAAGGLPGHNKQEYKEHKEVNN